ncbi:MAG: hypothetical protein KDA95_08445 [Acidimicrobiales bacterium]|nr:hypothetical protein [Acidimicrobiales bacterium]
MPTRDYVTDDWEKRIGRRREIAPVPMTWCSNPKKAPKKCKDADRVDGHLVDLSVTGAGARARTLDGADPGSIIMIHCLGHYVPVVIRRVDSDPELNQSYYGFELLAGAQPLADELNKRYINIDPDLPMEYHPRG